MALPQPEQLQAVINCVSCLGAPVLPIWGVNDHGICDCPKKEKCTAPGKHPHKLVPNGVNGATRDIAIIRQWGRSYTNANWAVRCGEAMVGGGFLAILDEDPRNGSEESIASLPSIPETVGATSGGAGRHRCLRFRRPPASRVIGPGLDLQGVGKYIVISPSRHHTGGYYAWNLGEEPGAIDVADAPEWLEDGTEEGTPRPERDNENSAEFTVLGELFKLSGRAGEVLPNGQMQVNCPNSHNHSGGSGQGQDSSTVVLPPAGGSMFGGWSCKHSSCANLKWADILKMMPEQHVAAAKKKYPAIRSVPVVTESVPIYAEDDTEDPYAKVKLEVAWQGTKSGWEPKHDIVNAISILTYDPRWIGVLKFDEFSQVLRFVKQPEWFKDDAPKVPSDVWSDDDTTRLDAWMRRAWGLRLASTELAKAAYVVGRRDAVNPLRDWLSSLVWDQVPRLSTWLVRYLGAKDTPYVRSVSRNWLIAGVARGVSPGTKVDNVLILEGGQGVGKSTALRTLAGNEKYFTDSPIDIGNKDAFVSLRGRWIIELAELASLSNRENEKSKAFFSSATDSYRPPYGRELVAVPRSCIFAGSTNAGQYLNDDSGGRRYWPIKVGVIDIDGLDYDKDQLWAEAYTAYKGGETWWPEYAELPLYEAEQLKREVSDAWEEEIGPWLQTSQAAGLLKDPGYVTVMQILQFALRFTPKDVDTRTAMRVSRVMYSLGYKKDRVGSGQTRTTGFMRASR